MTVLDGRVVIVTGGGRGIGAAVAKRLAAEGASVVVNDLGVAMDGSDPSSEPANEVVSEILSNGGRAVTDFHDVSDFTEAQELIATAVDSFGKLDVVVNAAGVLRDRMIFNMEEHEWDQVINVHLKGTFNTCRWASTYWRGLRQADAHHRIINFSSGSALFGQVGHPNYAAAKAGVIGLTYTCANSLYRYGVTANCICPMAGTRMNTTESIPQDKLDAMGTDFASEELQPANVVPVISYLASERSDWISGWNFGSWGHQLTLYSNPEVACQIASNGPWESEKLAEMIEETFRPTIEGYTNPILREHRGRAADAVVAG